MEREAIKRELPWDPAREVKTRSQYDEHERTERLNSTHPSRKNRRSTVFEEVDKFFVDVLAIRDNLEDVLSEPLVGHQHITLGASVRSPRVLYTPSHGFSAVSMRRGQSQRLERTSEGVDVLLDVNSSEEHSMRHR